jgi:hypothetical protein
VHDGLFFQALLLGGRAGAGKTTTGWEISAQLQAARIAHCLIEGDNLDQAFPAPPGDPARTRLTEANLAAMWRNYAALGYRRLIYTNTVSVLEPDMITRAMGGTVHVTAVLLTASDTTVAGRLAAGRSAASSARTWHAAPPWRTTCAPPPPQASIAWKPMTAPSPASPPRSSNWPTGQSRQSIAVQGLNTEP